MNKKVLIQIIEKKINKYMLSLYRNINDTDKYIRLTFLTRYIVILPSTSFTTTLAPILKRKKKLFIFYQNTKTKLYKTFLFIKSQSF